MGDKLVTIVGGSYFEPIAHLYAELADQHSDARGAIQAGPRENGFAAAVCILSVACLESYAMRAWYLHNPQSSVPRDLRIVDFLPALYVDFPFAAELTELYVQRDVIIHNHLWEIAYAYDDKAKMVKRGVMKLSAGDKKYQRCATRGREVTPRLRLSLNPVLVGRGDAKRVVTAVWRILQFLELKDHNQCGVSHVPIKYNGAVWIMADLLGGWRAKWQLSD